MTDKKTSQERAGATPADVDIFRGVQSGENVKWTFSQVKTWARGWLSKIEVGLGNVDNTSDANKPVSTAQATALAAKLDDSQLDTDGTLSANSDTRIASQKAVKTYADGLIAANDAMVFKNVIDCSANPNYPAADRGWTYRVSVAGKIGGASGAIVEAGDILLCLTDGTAAGNQATVGANWGIIQVNIDGSVTLAGAQTLTNKTLTSPSISNPTFTGTVTASGSFGAWEAYTPTVAAASGTITTSSATGAWWQLGKTVFFTLKATVTTNGTGVVGLRVSIPVASKNEFAATGKNTGSGKMVAGVVVATDTILLITDYLGSYPIADGQTIDISGSYETA